MVLTSCHVAAIFLCNWDCIQKSYVSMYLVIILSYTKIPLVVHMDRPWMILHNEYHIGLCP